MNHPEFIKKSLSATQSVFNISFSSKSFIESIDKAASLLINSYKKQGKVLLAGNGGSAADCQHICAELVGRLNFDRNPLPAIALTTNTSNLTCIANDYGYDDVFLRQLKGLGSKNDTLIVYTTSGKSKNIIEMISVASNYVDNVISLTGEYTKEVEKYSDVVISVPSRETTKIQEVHAVVGHILCECVEETLFKKT